jgi:hypothetical protein
METSATAGTFPSFDYIGLLSSKGRNFIGTITKSRGAPPKPQNAKCAEKTLRIGGFQSKAKRQP